MTQDIFIPVGEDADQTRQYTALTPPFERESVRALLRYIERRDKALRQRYPHGFVRDHIPGEFYPQGLANCPRMLVMFFGEDWLRAPLGECKSARVWHEYDGDEWHINELSGADQRALLRATPELDEVPLRLWDEVLDHTLAVEDGVVYWMDGERPMPPEVSSAWDAIESLPALAANAEDGR